MMGCFGGPKNHEALLTTQEVSLQRGTKEYMSRHMSSDTRQQRRTLHIIGYHYRFSTCRRGLYTPGPRGIHFVYKSLGICHATI